MSITFTSVSQGLSSDRKMLVLRKERWVTLRPPSQTGLKYYKAWGILTGIRGWLSWRKLIKLNLAREI